MLPGANPSRVALASARPDAGGWRDACALPPARRCRPARRRGALILLLPAGGQATQRAADAKVLRGLERLVAAPGGPPGAVATRVATGRRRSCAPGGPTCDGAAGRARPTHASSGSRASSKPFGGAIALQPGPAERGRTSTTRPAPGRPACGPPWSSASEGAPSLLQRRARRAGLRRAEGLSSTSCTRGPRAGIVAPRGEHRPGARRTGPRVPVRLARDETSRHDDIGDRPGAEQAPPRTRRSWHPQRVFEPAAPRRRVRRSTTRTPSRSARGYFSHTGLVWAGREAARRDPGLVDDRRRAGHRGRLLRRRGARRQVRHATTSERSRARSRSVKRAADLRPAARSG